MKLMITSRRKQLCQISAVSTALLFLSGCSTMHVPPVVAESTYVPTKWTARLPTAERSATLQAWWQSQNEPELAQLIATAQSVSPDIATALARIEQAKSLQAQARAAHLPSLSATASQSRMHAPLYNGTYVQNQAGLQIGWELDLARLRGADTMATRAQLESAQARWHDARILMAAEVADLYYASRAFQQQKLLIEEDVASYEVAEQWLLRLFQEGLVSDADLATARVNASESRARLQQQQASCDVQVKGLVAMTGQSESEVRQLMQAAWSRPGSPVPFAIAAVPVQTLAQRPDIYMAERDVLQAQATVLQAEAARLPRLSLEGFVGRGNFIYGGTTTNASTWTFGPLALTLPIFDGGRREAEQRAAEADVKAALSIYQSRVRQGVREVEEALVQLDSAEKRWLESRTTAQQALIRLQSNQNLLQEGLLSALEFEDIRRQTRVSESNSFALDLERQRAWITLYRAIGGGFQPSSLSLIGLLL